MKITLKRAVEWIKQVWFTMTVKNTYLWAHLILGALIAKGLHLAFADWIITVLGTAIVAVLFEVWQQRKEDWTLLDALGDIIGAILMAIIIAI